MNCAERYAAKNSASGILIQNELEALAADNASQAEVTDAIAVGDSVRCVCTACGEKAWIGRIVLLYPGRCLPGAEEAEKRIVGCKVGQEITCTVGQWEMTVTIEGAVRQITSAVNDAFVVSLNIPGVSTVAEYSRWYHQQHDMERKTKASYGITHFWLTQTAERSTYEIDEEEKWQWCLERGKIMFEGMLAAGVDMRIPEEGFEILTDEQAIEKAAREQERNFMYANNRAYPNDIAIEYLGSKITYGELFLYIDECVKSLTALQVKQGDIVTIAMPSTPEVLYILYALNKMGAVANMIHPFAGESEILRYLNEVNSEVAILFEGTYAIVKNSICTTSVKKAVVVSAGDSLPFGIKQLYTLKNKLPQFPADGMFMNWKQFKVLGNGVTVWPIEKDSTQVAIMSHTGGTTGEPKGVMCSDRNINALIWQIGCNLKYQRQEKYMNVLPPFLNYSLVNSMLEPLAFGFQVILIPKYEPGKFDEYIKKYQPNHISSIPDYWEAILTNEKLKQMDLSCLNHIFYGGEAMNPQKEQEINDFLLSRGARNIMGKGLGSTEMVSASTFTYEACNVMGSVGCPLVRVNCKIVEPETFDELPYNQIGEICFAGDTLMLGYYNHQEATDAIIKYHPDGIRWMHTGDLGYVTEDGVVFITGRIKRILPAMGNDGKPTKMFPDRIEKAVMKHPAVALCCVIGIPDPARTHYPRAYVILNEGYHADKEMTNALLAHCKGELPDYMIPEEIIYRNEFPRTSRGKVDYRALEREAAKER